MKKWTTFAAVAILGAGATSLALRGSTLAANAATTETISFDKKVQAFSLPDPSGKSVTVGNWDKSKATVMIFISTKCPVSNAYNDRMEALSKTFTSKGVKFYGINSNFAESGADVAAHAKAKGLDFTILKDPHNKIADRFDAKVTPEAYVVGPKGDLLYHGRVDNSMQPGEVNSKSLEIALTDIVAGKPVADKETQAFGCSIKREN